jgi:hypothetical protein
MQALNARHVRKDSMPAKKRVPVLHARVASFNRMKENQHATNVPQDSFKA